MKKLSKSSKAALIALGIAGLGVGAGTAAVASGKISLPQTEVSDAVAAAQSKISLEQAIAIAQKTVKGDLLGAEFDYENDYGIHATSEYEVKFASGNNEIEVKIDANTGKVLKTEQEQMDEEDLAEYTAMKQAKVSLTQAMQIAQQKVNGKIIEAEFDLEQNKPVYEIEIAKGTQVQKIVIDASSGTIMTNQVDTLDRDSDDHDSDDYNSNDHHSNEQRSYNHDNHLNDNHLNDNHFNKGEIANNANRQARPISQANPAATPVAKVSAQPSAVNPAQAATPVK